MKLFDIIDGKVIMNPTMLWLPEFKALWDRDKSKSKEKAAKEISYIVFLYDFKSPYMAYPSTERERRIIADYIRVDNWVPDELVLAAIAKYKELQTSPLSRLLQAALDTCDKMTDYYKGVDFSLIDNDGKPVYSLKDVSSAMKQIGDIVSSLETMKDKVEKEQSERGAIRGGSGIGLFER